MKVKLISMTENPIDLMWTAARTCYSEKSPIEIWEEENRYPKLKGNDAITDEYYNEMQNKMWKLVKKVLDSGHQCYDDKTEVLTSNGFKLWKDITGNDLIGAVNPNSYDIQYEKPKDVFNYLYEGKMYYFNNKYINLCVTPNHRLYASIISSVHDKFSENYQFYRCDEKVYKVKKKTNREVAFRPIKFKVNCETSSFNNYNPLNLPQEKIIAFNKLMGFFVGDGYAEGGNRLEFHLKKERKITYLKNIVSILEWDLKEYLNNKYKVFFDDIGNFARLNYYNDKSKKIPLEFLTCSKECILAFIDGLMNSDGSRYRKNSFTYITTSLQVANILQAMCHIAGGYASLIEKNRQVLPEKWSSQYIMEVCLDSPNTNVLVNDTRHTQKDTSIIDYKGYVYCCEVSTGLLLVRRNNKVCLCGNSIAEYVNFVFAIEGVDRALTHQFVRHRHATFSQQSQRYVEIKESFDTLSELFENPKTDKDEDYLYSVADKYFVDVTRDNYRLYIQPLLSYLHSIKLGMKPEEARKFLINATKTNLVFGTNLRELMHTCGLRLCTRAQLPIRTLFREIVNCVKEKDERIGSLLVPKCDIYGFCNEEKNCGRKPKKEDVLNG